MGPCIGACFKHRSTFPQMVHIFLLHLSARSFSGLAREAYSPPIFFARLLARQKSPIWVIKSYSTPWIFAWDGFSAMSHLEILIRDPFHSWGVRSALEGPLVDQCLRRFQRGSQSCWWIFLVDTVRADLFVPYDIFWGTCSCLQVLNHLTARMAELPWYIACPSVSCGDRGSKILG